MEPKSKDFLFDDLARSEKIYLKYKRRQHKNQRVNCLTDNIGKQILEKVGIRKFPLNFGVN